MTAEQALHKSLWHKLPTMIKNSIEYTVNSGCTRCEIPDENFRNVDIMEVNGILRYLGYDVSRTKNSERWLISWDDGYRNRY